MGEIKIEDRGDAILVDARGLGGAPVKRGERYAYADPRDLSDVDAVGLHHWGPPSPSLVPRRGETLIDAAVRRSRSVAYHASTWAPPGYVPIAVLAWPLELVTWHGNYLNRRSVGVAFAGCFPALESMRAGGAYDDPLAHRTALRAVLEVLARELPVLRFILTHSQAAQKPADPGELAARLAVAEGAPLGLAPLPDWVAPRPKPSSPRGSPWPAEWRRPLGDPGACPTCGRPFAAGRPPAGGG